MGKSVEYTHRLSICYLLNMKKPLNKHYNCAFICFFIINLIDMSDKFIFCVNFANAK